MRDFTKLTELPDYQLATHPKVDSISTKINGQWKKFSTKDVIDQINIYSRAFVSFGLQPGDKVALISNNRPEWNFSDLGMLKAGLINVPIYPTISESDYKFIFNDAEIKIALVSDKGLFDKITSIQKEVPTLQAIYTFDEVAGASHIHEFLQKGADTALQVEVDRRNAAIQPGDLATIIYTSGTTGVPKGVMLSHHNIVTNIKATVSVLPIDHDKRVLSFLPLCHIFERMVCYTYLAVGCSIYYAESMETIADNLKEVKPHFFTTVPRLLEKVYDKIVSKGNDLTGIKRTLFFWALDLGLQFNEEGKNSAWYNFKLAIARKLIFSKWQEALGGELIGIVTGAAALQTRLAKVFSAAGIKVRQGYGQTETSPVLTVDRFDEGEYCLGTVGQVIPGVDVKIAENGEILAKGPNIMMGYYKRPDITAETIRDGWIHTGDVGEFYQGKYLRITDRVKELFKTSGGKYVAPQVIENKVKESPLIEQVMVVGENERFVAALIVPSMDQLTDWAKRNQVQETDTAKLLSHPAVLKRYQQEIDGFNEDFGQVEKVKAFKLLPNQWTIETGELTPTMKIKRKVVLQKYQSEIEAFYR